MGNCKGFGGEVQGKFVNNRMEQQMKFSIPYPYPVFGMSQRTHMPGKHAALDGNPKMDLRWIMIDLRGVMKQS